MTFHSSRRYYCVAVHSSVAGFLVQSGDLTYFEWSHNYWQDPERHVLSLSFEDNPKVAIRSSVRVPPWFSNLLPEGVLRNWIARHYGINPAREMEVLARIGADLPGAVRIWEIREEPHFNWEDSDFIDAEADPSSALENSAFRFSLAGVQPKFSMLAEHDRLTLPLLHESGDWIVKTPDSNFPLVPLNEYATMSFARDVGIDVPEFRMLHRDELTALPTGIWIPGEEFAFAIRRFDRKQGGRVHMEDLAQVKAVYPDRKYEGNYETVAALVYRGHDRESLRRFVRRLVFSILVGNSDMHLKNVSLLYESPTVPILSPAYDLVSTCAYFPEQQTTEEIGLKLGGSRARARLRRNSFYSLARHLGIDFDELFEWIRADMDVVLEKLDGAIARYGALENHKSWLAAEVPSKVGVLRS